MPLYLIATPIGNLGDITRRAAETLAQVDFIAAEDTRVTAKLLNHLKISKPLISYYEHNKAERGEKIVARLLQGESCALVSDAGTPAISDPGEELVSDCIEAGIEVYSLPGPCAAITALTISGLPTGRFTFEGFLSTAKKSRFAHLESLKNEKRTMIFYEAPHKLRKTLADMLTAFGDRRIALCREMTKLYEECRRETLSQAVAHYEENAPRGEFVLIIEGASEEPATPPSLAEAVSLAEDYIRSGMSGKDAARQAANETAFGKNEIYSTIIKNKADS